MHHPPQTIRTIEHPHAVTAGDAFDSLARGYGAASRDVSRPSSVNFSAYGNPAPGSCFTPGQFKQDAQDSLSFVDKSDAPIEILAFASTRRPTKSPPYQARRRTATTSDLRRPRIDARLPTGGVNAQRRPGKHDSHLLSCQTSLVTDFSCLINCSFCILRRCRHISEGVCRPCSTSL